MTHETIHRYLHLRAVAVLAVMFGAGLLAAAPAMADRDGGPSFHFSFGFPPPPVVVVPPPPPVYYYEPAPRVVIQHRPYYRAWYYREGRYADRDWRRHPGHGRHYRHHHDD